MANVKFYVVTGLFIIGAGVLGYAAINSLRDPVYYANNQEIVSSQLSDETIGQLTSASQNNVANSLGNTATSSTTGGVQTSGTTAQVPPTSATASTTSGTSSAANKNADLIARLKKIPAGTVLKKGDNNDHVKAVQDALNIAGKAGLTITGSAYGNFGPGTEAAVKDFQKANNISPQSGQVASQTLAKLIEKLQ